MPIFLVQIQESVSRLVIPTLWAPIDCRPPGSSVHRIFQARKLEWFAIPFSRESSQLRCICLQRSSLAWMWLWGWNPDHLPAGCVLCTSHLTSLGLSLLVAKWGNNHTYTTKFKCVNTYKGFIKVYGTLRVLNKHLWDAWTGYPERWPLGNGLGECLTLSKEEVSAPVPSFLGLMMPDLGQCPGICFFSCLGGRIS